MMTSSSHYDPSRALADWIAIRRSAARPQYWPDVLSGKFIVWCGEAGITFLGERVAHDATQSVRETRRPLLECLESSKFGHRITAERPSPGSWAVWLLRIRTLDRAGRFRGSSYRQARQDNSGFVTVPMCQSSASTEIGDARGTSGA